MSNTDIKTQLEQILLAPPEAAHVLAISERFLWNKTHPRGPIPCIRLGKSVRYSADALKAYVAGQTAAATSEG